MKKLIAITLVVVLTLSLLTACGGASTTSGSSGDASSSGRSSSVNNSATSPASSEKQDSNDKPDSDGKPVKDKSDDSSPEKNKGDDSAREDNSGGTGEMGDLLSATYAQIMKSNKYYMRYTTRMEFSGQVSEGRTEVAKDNDNVAMIGESSFGGMTYRSRMITKGDTMYLIDDDAKTITELTTSSSDDEESDTDFSDIVFLGKGTGTINDKTLEYEEYDNDGAKMRYYFDGKTLYALESIGDGGESMVMIIEEISNKIPSGMFDIPKDYTTTDGW